MLSPVLCVKCHKLHNISWFTFTKKGENVKIILSIKKSVTLGNGVVSYLAFYSCDKMP